MKGYTRHNLVQDCQGLQDAFCFLGRLACHAEGLRSLCAGLLCSAIFVPRRRCKFGHVANSSQRNGPILVRELQRSTMA